MNLPRPTAQEERWLAVADRYPALHDAAEARANGWKTPSLLSRVLMFVLGLFAASLITGSLLWMPGRFLVAGVAMVAAGEWLIRSRRLVAGGIEEALIACGAAAIVGETLAQMSGVGDGASVALFSLAVLAAGLRLGNALFTTLAALGVSLAVAFAGGPTLFGSGGHGIAAGSFCIAVALAALFLGGLRWQRPSHDRMLDGLVVAMPAAAQAWAIDALPSPGAAALGIGFALTLAVVGLKRRTHAPLLAALLQLAFVAYDLRELTGLPLHARLVLWGTVLFALGFALDRGLRRPRGGITSAPLGRRSRLQDLVEVYGAAHVAPPGVHSAAAPPAGVEGQGGSFGGGGASGRY